jgi:site-specific DNA-methyltransferase (cytosine-N4-specific)
MHVDQQSERFSTANVARMAGVHKDTLLRWLRSGLIQEPHRDRHGWRYFSPHEARAVVAFAKQSSAGPAGLAMATERRARDYLGRLSSLDWNFANAKTNYLTHGIHPYPAKFIPQIPNALIQELSAVGDTVGDIFCGSGTTLVEALTLKRHAVGIDANPLACLISEAKTATISEAEAANLSDVARRARAAADELSASSENSLLPGVQFRSKEWRPEFARLEFWFASHVIEELAETLAWCKKLDGPSRKVALTAFSAIVVAVSRQDSDTRYVRREKNVPPGETFRRFSRSLEQATRTAVEFTELVEPRFRREVLAANLLDSPSITPLDLVVCSPPYPNAYSYHLYHMTRMVWLGMDQPKFKKEEIGSHRKYSSKGVNAATVNTFKSEFGFILRWLAGVLKPGAYACFVVGDSTLKGERISNADLISEVGIAAGFREATRLHRNMLDTKKAFNPAIGKIKTEKILVLENRRAVA